MAEAQAMITIATNGVCVLSVPEGQCEWVWQGQRERNIKKKKKWPIGVSIAICECWEWHREAVGSERDFIVTRRKRIASISDARTESTFGGRLANSWHMNMHKMCALCELNVQWVCCVYVFLEFLPTEVLGKGFARCGPDIKGRIYWYLEAIFSPNLYKMNRHP